MDEDRAELVHRLFALATEIAEAAHETAVSGQASVIPPAKLVCAAADLCRRGHELMAIGQAVSIALGNETREAPSENSS